MRFKGPKFPTMIQCLGYDSDSTPKANDILLAHFGRLHKMVNKEGPGVPMFAIQSTPNDK